MNSNLRIEYITRNYEMLEFAVCNTILIEREKERGGEADRRMHYIDRDGKTGQTDRER